MNNLGLAAQAWCTTETSSIEMDSRLATEFAKMLDDKDKVIGQLQDLAIWMTGCGYSFTDHSFFLDNRDLLTLDVNYNERDTEV